MLLVWHSFPISKPLTRSQGTWEPKNSAWSLLCLPWGNEGVGGPPPTSTGYTGLALELRGEEAVERPAVGKEELKSMKQDGGKKSEKEGRDWREWEKTEACMGGGPPATAAFSPTQDWDLL